MKKDKIQLWMPLKNAILTQGYYENANSWYKEHDMLGHGAYDYVTHYDDKVLFAEDGFVYKIINKDADISKFRAVFQLVELEDNYVLEICYGHANSILVGNAYYNHGIPCITEGNSGGVFSDGKAVSVEAREKGSQAGTHLHIQGRLCRKTKESIAVLSPDRLPQYLSSQDDATKPYQDKDGFIYNVVDYYNGYHGCAPIEWIKYDTNNQAIIKLIAVLEFIISILKGRLLK